MTTLSIYHIHDSQQIAIHSVIHVPGSGDYLGLRNAFQLLSVIGCNPAKSDL